MDDLIETVRRALHTSWDPIGLSALTTEMGEYDSYVAGLCELLRNHASQLEIFNYLWTVETISIGLRGNRQETERFAKWLYELSATIGS